MNLFYLLRAEPEIFEKKIQEMRTTGIFVEGQGWEYPEVKLCAVVDVAIRKEFAQAFIDSNQDFHFLHAIPKKPNWLEKIVSGLTHLLFYFLKPFGVSQMQQKKNKRIEHAQMYKLFAKEDGKIEGREIR